MNSNLLIDILSFTLASFINVEADLFLIKMKFLVTGAHGQIGKGLIPSLIKKYGKASVLATDISEKSEIKDCLYSKLDVRDKNGFDALVKDNKINYIVHLAGIISALGEKNPVLAREVNIDSVFTSFELARKYKTKVFIPSTIAVYGGEYNKARVSPDLKTSPTTLYGVSKILMENLGDYYRSKYDVDFRCLRYTAVVSPFEYAYNGSAYYATEIFFKAVQEGKYSINVNKDRILPLCHLDDIVNGTIKVLEADRNNLTRNVYNINGLNFSANDLVNEIRKYIPKFEAIYEPKIQDTITATWPESTDDSASRKDWGWAPEYESVPVLVKTMIENAKATLPKI